MYKLILLDSHCRFDRLCTGNLSELFSYIENWCIENKFHFDIENIHYIEKIKRLKVCVVNNDIENRVEVKEFSISRVK